MPNIQTLPLGGYETNCYLVYAQERTDCVLIDPGYDPQAIIDALEDLGRVPAAIFLTHGHFDHVGAVQSLLARFSCPVWIHEKDFALPHDAFTLQLYPLANCNQIPVCFFEDGKTISVAGLDFTVHATPGHTEGSVCLECENALFCGDTLFAGSCGRTDLPGGNIATMRKTLAYLSSLDKNFALYPGHGDNSCLDAEKRYNPYLKGLL